MKHMTKIKSTKLKIFGSDNKEEMDEFNEDKDDIKKVISDENLPKEYNYLLNMPIW